MEQAFLSWSSALSAQGFHASVLYLIRLTPVISEIYVLKQF